MSGIFGFLNLDGAPTSAADLQSMASTLDRRGPEGTGLWHANSVGLGHTLLATTPEALFERLPLQHAASGCVITADVRLDNRNELLANLGLSERAATIGDAEIILMAYLAWGGACAERLLGDFAFAIWDARDQKVFCARDQFGMRPFYYHHTPAGFFAFASEPRAILVLPRTPYRINEVRIAESLVAELEVCDNTSTYFEEVYRLPPAHSLTVSAKGACIERYWKLEPRPRLNLPSDEAYAEAFLEVFTEAVSCRLRSAGPVGSMLSGGMDSGSVVAVARTLLDDAGRGPLHTFSATAPDPSNSIETRTIQAALTMDGLCPHTVSFAELDKLMPTLGDLTWSQTEPFDSLMTLIRAVYLLAHQEGIKVVLDGVGGDMVLTKGSHLARLWRAGRWITAAREVVGESRYYGAAPWENLYRTTRSAMVPNWARRVRQRITNEKRLKRAIRDSMISPDFARRTALHERWQLKNNLRSTGILSDYSLEQIKSIDNPDLIVGREFYDRAAASVGVEPRDPFLDRRLVTFCLSLPGDQKLGGGGWPKIILRRAMAGRMPDAVRWRRGRTHVGWSFTSALIDRMRDRMRDDINMNWSLVAPYIDAVPLRERCTRFLSGIDKDGEGQAYVLSVLCHWLRAHAQRPEVVAQAVKRLKCDL